MSSIRLVKFFRSLKFSKIFFCCLFYFFSTMNWADTRLETLNNTSISWESLKGKWVFINIWASWCAPCVEEISELNRFYAKNKNKGVAVFAVNYDGVPRYKQQRLVQKFSIHYPSLTLNALASLHLGELSVVPVTYVFGPDGKMTTALYGGQTFHDFQAAMRY